MAVMMTVEVDLCEQSSCRSERTIDPQPKAGTAVWDDVLREQQQSE